MRKSKLGIAVTVAAAALTFGVQAKETAVAIFAGGCFWSIESDFDHAPGVLDTTSGYIGGHVANPTYEQVSTETTGHREAVRVTYDPAVTSYEKLLAAYWHMTDPTDGQGQFCDYGDSYRPGLFPLDKAQYDAAEASKGQVAKELGKPIATTIAMASQFYPAEDYHQNFWKTNSAHYKAYRAGCGKNAKVEALWGKTAFEGLNGHE
ncbi:peptide methionine sulfoxide reductase MsrA [Youhaiella tibetensis]|uniref:Peptide methionine sulfoxide reductase MsrA n=1 Tax=Paradevosia tibetensis TaxID=1447062 RepID=A0A5B9DQI5_9HYPH|nr:peptide-methionine (S)-S-oxide reductase MsrA [Youhaiella tibetensis]AKR56256.1 peptide methionine sulfoxide reductase [Devosia sp. H5989]QEE21312.1 peptide-methionine (S)-S-oxide reductase MsrA [Youhaiella tibetensis]GGF16090.1 peptide methionine sulfoxide reductase MsrA [Youhaiella tibetensis]